LNSTILNNLEAGVDLHIHTSASDGTKSPENIVDMAIENKLSVIAVTDHDTTASVPAALSYTENKDISVIPGIEISTSFAGQSIHILGLGINHTNEQFQKVLEKIQHGRNMRNPRIIQLLNIAGLDLTLQDALDCAGGKILGRLHIAQAMLNKGYVQSIDHAFKRFLTKGTIAYVERYRPDPDEATSLIKDAGGVPVLAHPGLMKFDNISTLKSHIKRLKNMGIEGIETHYPTHSPELFSSLSEIAEELNLLETGGSDYHGMHKPNRIGFGCAGKPITAGFAKPFLERFISSRKSEINTSNVI